MTGAGEENISEKKKSAKELFEKGKNLEKEDHYEEAVRLFEEALGLDRDNDAIWSEKADALVLLGLVSNDQKFFDKALKDITEALRINQNNAKALNNKGFILVQREQNEEGLQLIEQALKSDPTYSDAWDNKGNALTNLGEFDKAQAAYDQAIKTDPDYHSPYCNKGMLFTKIGKNQESFELFDQALQRKPNYPNVIYGKGVAWLNLGDNEKALESFSRFHKMRPQDTNALIYLGFISAELRRYADAIEHFDKVLKIDPKNVSAWWGKMYTEKSMQLDYEYSLNEFQVNLVVYGQKLIAKSLDRLDEFYEKFDKGFQNALTMFIIQFTLGIAIFFGGLVLYAMGATALMSIVISITGGVTFIHSLITSSPYAIMKNRTDFSQWMIAYTHWVHALIDANKLIAQQRCTGAGDWDKIKNIHKDLWELTKDTIYVIEECCESNKHLDLKRSEKITGATEPPKK